MFKNRTIRLTLLILIVAMALLAGCSSKGPNGNSSSTNENGKKTATPDLELIYATAKDINDMNPHLYTGSMPAQGIVYESLLENTEDGIKPLLAESWEISEDGKIYTFHLRKNVTFHDGAPFNAEAVKKNIDAVQNNASKHAWIKLSTKLLETKVIDEHTVQLILSEPYYPTLLELSMTRPYVFLSPNDFINGETKDGVNGYNGTGPYQLTEHKTDQYATFVANEHYWNGVPRIHKIMAKVLPAGETTFLALQKGEVNFVFTDDRGTDSIDVEAMNTLADSGKYQIVRSAPMNTKIIVANSSRTDSPAADKAVREAIWHSIDRETISRELFNGKELPAEALFSSNVNYADIDLEKRAYDLDTAKKLLDEAGWTLQTGDEIRKKNGNALIMGLYYDISSFSQKSEAELLQNTLKKIGIQLELVGEESTSIANRRATGEYDLLFNQTWGLAYDPQSTIASFTSEAAYYHATSGIAKADALYKKIEEVMISSDEATR